MFFTPLDNTITAMFNERTLLMVLILLASTVYYYITISITITTIKNNNNNNNTNTVINNKALPYHLGRLLRSRGLSREETLGESCIVPS